MLARFTSGIALASMAALVLVGCTPQEPVETTPPPESPQPSVENSENPLLDEAESVYENFLNTRTELTESPDADVAALLEFATERQASATFGEVAELVQAGQMLDGSFAVTGSSLVSEDDESAQLIICVDNSNVVVVDRQTGDSQSTTPAPPALVTFANGDTLKVDEVGEVPPGEALSCE